MFCKNCGQQINDSAKFCPVCGFGRKNDTPAEDQIQGHNTAPVSMSMVPVKEKTAPKKNRTWLIILLSVLGTLITGAVLFVVLAIVLPDSGKENKTQNTRETVSENDALEEMLALFLETEETGNTWVETVGNWEDLDASIEATELFYRQLTDQEKRMKKIDGLPENIRAAGDDYFDLYLTAISDLHKNMVFYADFLALYDTLDPEDLVKTCHNFRKQYDSVECPDNLRDSWVSIGRSIDYLETSINRSADAEELGDGLRWFSSDNHLQRFARIVDNEAEVLDGIINDELQFAVSQGDAADAIYDEIYALYESKEDDLSSYTFKYKVKDVLSEPSYDHIDTIYPTIYNSYDSFVTVKMGCIQGERDVIVDCEIPGLSQATSQSYHIGSALTVLNIKPPASNEAQDLDNPMDTQIRVSIRDKADGNVIDEQSFPVHIASRNDFVWISDEFGLITQDNILCFLSPESEAIAELKRNAIDELSSLTDGDMTYFVGYQGPIYVSSDDPDDEEIMTGEMLSTFLQAAALMRAVSDMGVRYTNDTFSITKDAQHILFPDQVLKRKTGLCIETSLVIASALQSAGMHVFLVLPPGHAQVAVETWEGSGQYFLIETTTVPNSEQDFLDEAQFFLNGWEGIADNEPISFLDTEQWISYLVGDENDDYDDCYVIDCSDGALLGLTPFVQ